jgi:hypothetical protein
VDTREIGAAFEDAFDQAVVFHGFADYMRDYDVFVHAIADPRTGIRPVYLRYRFICCVQADVTSSLSPATWKRSMDERLVDYKKGRDLRGYVWGVRWQLLYPGMDLVQDSADARRWTDKLGVPFHQALIEANAQRISLIFTDLAVDTVDPGCTPFAVPGEEPGDKTSIR